MRNTLIAPPEAQPATEPPMDMHTPPEIMAEVLIERMAVLRARLAELTDAASTEEDRAVFDKLRWHIHALRLQFNPHDRLEVHAMDGRMDVYARAIGSGRASAVAQAQ